MIDRPAGFRHLYTSAYGVKHYMRTNPDGSYTFAAGQDVEPVLDRNKAMANHNDGYNAKRDMRRVASIPFALWLKVKSEQGIDLFDPDNKDALVRILNDPDYAYLRTAPGRIGLTNGVMR